MIKPEVIFSGEGVYKTFHELENGEWFLDQLTQHLCSIVDRQLHLDGSVIELKYYDHLNGVLHTALPSHKLWIVYVKLVKVRIEYTIATKGDLK